MSPILQTQLGVHDVLLGRGSGPNGHEGNKHFRAMAAEALKRCITLAAYHPLMLDLARELVAMVHTRKGRFVRKLTKGEVAAVSLQILKTSDKKLLKKHKKMLGDLYVVVPEKVAIDKAKQSFRHQLRRMSSEAGTAGSGTAVGLNHCPPSSSTTIVEQESTAGQAPLMKWSLSSPLLQLERSSTFLQTLHHRRDGATRLEDLTQEAKEENVVRANLRIQHQLGRASTITINDYAGAGVGLPPKRRTQDSPQQKHHALLDPGAFMMMGRSSHEQHHLLPLLQQKSHPTTATTATTASSVLLRRACRHPVICNKNKDDPLLLTDDYSSLLLSAQHHNKDAPSFQHHHAPSPPRFGPDLLYRSTRDAGHGRRSLLLVVDPMFRAGLPRVPPPPSPLLRGLFTTTPPAFSLIRAPPPGGAGASVLLAYPRSVPAFHPLSLPATASPPGGGQFWSYSHSGRPLSSSSSSSSSSLF
jgi:hypothetical protein